MNEGGQLNVVQQRELDHILEDIKWMRAARRNRDRHIKAALNLGVSIVKVAEVSNLSIADVRRIDQSRERL